MKVLIFNPYFDTLGGGERYTLQVVEFFLQKGAWVELAWRTEKIKDLTRSRFNININRVKINPNLYTLFAQKNNLFKKYKMTSQFDVTFFVSDGSIPFLAGKKNLLHFQVPFKNVSGRSLFNQLKLRFIHKIICNSFFTKKFIDQEFKTNSEVLYPSVSEGFKAGKKSNVILSVGRFDNLLNSEDSPPVEGRGVFLRGCATPDFVGSDAFIPARGRAGLSACSRCSKKQEVLVKVFKKLITERKLKNWRLILAGSVLGGDRFVKYLRDISKGFPIEIKANVDFGAVQKLYSQAKIYWHAAGSGEDLLQNPERAEHFGISVLEAMASGCVPIVFAGGGLPEIVEDGRSGFLFNTLSQIKNLTIKLVKDGSLLNKISQKAQKRVKDFSKEHFFQKLDEIIK